QRHQLRAAGRSRILDVGRRVADAIEEAVDLAVAQRRAVFIGPQFRGQREIFQGPAHRGQQFFHGRARARAWIADVEAFAFEVFERFDVGFFASYDSKWLGV